jgi:hypothetical protein
MTPPHHPVPHKHSLHGLHANECKKNCTVCVMKSDLTTISHMNQQKINIQRSTNLEENEYQCQFIYNTATESEPPHSRMWSLEYTIRGNSHSQEDESQHTSNKTPETKKQHL